MIRTATLETVIAVLFVLVILWIVILLFQRKAEHIGRALILAIVLGAAFFLVQQISDETIVFADIKESLFPPKPADYPYTVSKTGTGTSASTRYFFPEPGPRIRIKLDKPRKHFHIEDIRSVNRILEYLDLPLVTTGAQELSSLTGRTTDAGIYRWEDYPLGVLIIERGLCRDHDAADTFHCIVSITIQ